LPSWARRRTYPFLLFAGLGATLIAAIALLASKAPGAASVPALFAMAFGGWGWHVLRERRLLATGDGVAAGVVTGTGSSKGSWWATYEFPTPAGSQSGTGAFQSMIVVDNFGFRPEAGDTVFVVFDSRHSSRNAVWGFSPPQGQHRQLPWSDRPMPRWLQGVLLAVTIAAALAAAFNVTRAVTSPTRAGGASTCNVPVER
jgi:hypothetical protein